MQHSGTCTLGTERLILRPFTVEDAGAMYSNWGSDPDVTKYMPWAPHESVETARSILLEWVRQYEKKDTYNWAITIRKQGDEPVGGISVTHINEAVESVEVGYCIGKQWRNQGITSEALGCVIAFLFACVGVNRIEARHDIRNPASGKVMQKCGMLYEGTMREAGVNNQGICDQALYAVLKRDDGRANRQN